MALATVSKNFGTQRLVFRDAIIDIHSQTTKHDANQSERESAKIVQVNVVGDIPSCARSSYIIKIVTWEPR